MPLIGKKKQSGKNSGFFKALDFYRTVFLFILAVFIPVSNEPSGHACILGIVFWPISILIQKDSLFAMRTSYRILLTGNECVTIGTAKNWRIK